VLTDLNGHCRGVSRSNGRPADQLEARIR
jgi:hypothetical protein